jgi:HD superfamily phosphohydrolase
VAADLKQDVEKFATEQLDCVSAPFPKSGKVIHDAVWGSIHVKNYEVSLLDSSLFQRLRYLHQTAFAFLVYPSARHTRFEHSLGVLRQTDNHLRALKERFPSYVTEETIATLRLAALMHDCSHGMFSHTSEEIYRFLPDVLEYTSEKGKYPGHNASELIARFILESPHFRKTIDFFAKNKVAVHGSWEDLARLIAGDHTNTKPHDSWKVDVINGPLDADKLDYIARDGLHTGLPLSMDLERFWLSTEIQCVEKGKIKGITHDQTRLVINRSGINAIEQILFSRFQLTSSVYHHHKIRACDCFFKSWIEDQQEKGNFKSAIDFVRATDMDFLKENRLQRRALPKRVMALSFETLQSKKGPSAPLPDEFLGLVDEANQTAEGSGRLRKIAHRIAEEAGLKKEDHKLVWVDLPPLPKITGLGQTIVNQGTREKPTFTLLEEVFPINAWRTMYTQKNWRGHVFAPPDHVEKIKKIAVSTLEDEVKDLRVLPEAFSFCKLTPTS